MGKTLGYRKFCYWINPNELEIIEAKIQQIGLPLVNETRIPCRVLRKSIEVAMIFPQAWKAFCERRTSWYWNSKKVGNLLLVANRPLDFPEFKDAITITESEVKHDRYPSYEEMLRLLESEAYQKGKPLQWDNPNPAEKVVYQRWFNRYKVNAPFDFKTILIIHSANHANFIDPKYCVTVDGKQSPYSITDSLHSCSSCLEFFNILGDRWSTKYVVPCIGAVQFAKLPMDQYFEVKI